MRTRWDHGMKTADQKMALLKDKVVVLQKRAQLLEKGDWLQPKKAQNLKSPLYSSLCKNLKSPLYTRHKISKVLYLVLLHSSCTTPLKFEILWKAQIAALELQHIDRQEALAATQAQHILKSPQWFGLV